MNEIGERYGAIPVTAWTTQSNYTATRPSHFW